MTAVTFHDSVQNAVVNFVASRNFAKVDYPSGLRTTSSTLTEKASAQCHRKTVVFTNERKVVRQATGCLSSRPVMNEERWELVLNFHREVDLSGFESAFSAAALSAPVDPTNTDGPKVFIDLAEGEQDDPVEQQGSTGLRAVYRLRVHWPGT